MAPTLATPANIAIFQDIRIDNTLNSRRYRDGRQHLAKNNPKWLRAQPQQDERAALARAGGFPCLGPTANIQHFPQQKPCHPTHEGYYIRETMGPKHKLKEPWKSRKYRAGEETSARLTGIARGLLARRLEYKRVLGAGAMGMVCLFEENLGNATQPRRLFAVKMTVKETPAGPPGHNQPGEPFTDEARFLHHEFYKTSVSSLEPGTSI